MFAARQTAALVILPESTSPDPCTSSLCLRSLRAIFPQQDVLRTPRLLVDRPGHRFTLVTFLAHSDTNVLCLGGKIIGSAIALEIVRVWMATGWLGEGEGGEKYARRVNKVKDIAARHLVRLD